MSFLGRDLRSVNDNVYVLVLNPPNWRCRRFYQALPLHLRKASKGVLTKTLGVVVEAPDIEIRDLLFCLIQISTRLLMAVSK